MKKIFLFLIAILICSSAKAQFLEGLGTHIVKDTIQYKYGFIPGDTIYYKTMALDSIVVDFEPALTKIRHEKIKVWCDSIIADTAFKISIQMLEYKSREKVLNSDSIVERNEHPWVGKIISFVIDSSGKRLDYGFSHIKKSIIAPGTVFQTALIQPIGGGAHKENSTWLVKETYLMPENGVPASVIAQTSLLRAEKILDTLGYNCKSLNFTSTAQAIFKLETEETYVNLSVKKNFAGYLRFDSKTDLPINFWSSGQDILTIKDKDEKTKPGWVYSQLEFTAEKVLLSPKRNSININNFEIQE